MKLEQRQDLANQLAPFLEGKNEIGLAAVRAQLHHLAPELALEIDGKEASFILRRAGFERSYARPVGPPLYRRKVGA